MALNEEAMRFLEENIPELADAAVKQAYWQALASGSSVLESENDTVIEIHPDGTRKIIKKIEPSTPVKKGQRLELR